MASVDNRVVSLQFDDSQFDGRVKKALQSLTNLGRKVEETGRTKGNISGVSESLRIQFVVVYENTNYKLPLRKQSWQIPGVQLKR